MHCWPVSVIVNMCAWLSMLWTPCLIPSACIFHLTRGDNILIDWLIEGGRERGREGVGKRGNFTVELVSLNVHVVFWYYWTCYLHIRKHGCMLGIHDTMCSSFVSFCAWAHVCKPVCGWYVSSVSLFLLFLHVYMCVGLWACVLESLTS